jgi:hypothetical protein
MIFLEAGVCESVHVSVHFATAHAILNMLTPENQLIDFYKYPKSAKRTFMGTPLQRRYERQHLPFVFFLSPSDSYRASSCQR